MKLMASPLSSPRDASGSWVRILPAPRASEGPTGHDGYHFHRTLTRLREWGGGVWRACRTQKRAQRLRQVSERIGRDEKMGSGSVSAESKLYKREGKESSDE